MLTLKMLQEMKPDTTFAEGVTTDDNEGVNLSNSGRQLRWVACRGGIHDWAIYAQYAEQSASWVKRFGDKIHFERNIRKLVPCDDEALAMYRH